MGPWDEIAKIKKNVRPSVSAGPCSFLKKINHDLLVENFLDVMDLGMDTRAYRLEACKTFLNGCFEVDMANINNEKRAIFKDVLQNPASKCKLATQPIPVQ